MTSLLSRTWLHQTYHQSKKIRRHVRSLKRRGVDRCIVVSGYPKSGNTWLARMLADIAECEMAAYLTDKDDKLPREVGMVGREARRDTIVIKSHHTLPLLRWGGVAPSDLAIIVRDPRDVAVSGAGFFFAETFGKTNEPTPDSIDRMIDMMIGSERPEVRWPDQRWDSFVEKSLTSNLPIIRYVDLVKAPRETLEPVLSHLGLDQHNFDLDRIIDFHTFDQAKQRSERKGETAISHHLRSGRTGEYRKYLSRRQRERIENEFRPTMERLGYL